MVRIVRSGGHAEGHHRTTSGRPAKAVDAGEAQEKLAAVGCEPFKSAQQFAALIKDDLPQWAKIVKESGATID